MHRLVCIAALDVVYPVHRSVLDGGGLQFVFVFSDVNECLLDNGNCSDVCVNDVPFYQCECPTGAQLDPADNLTCVFNADCSQETGCECLPGYRNTSTDSSLNCTGKLLSCAAVICRPLE